MSAEKHKKKIDDKVCSNVWNRGQGCSKKE